VRILAFIMTKSGTNSGRTAGRAVLDYGMQVSDRDRARDPSLMSQVLGSRAV
jgi:hypothetical protein